MALFIVVSLKKMLDLGPLNLVFFERHDNEKCAKKGTLVVLVLRGGIPEDI